jgi:hypothetical protein
MGFTLRFIKMIEENSSILEMAKIHMDQRAILVLESRIDELKKMIGYEDLNLFLVKVKPRFFKFG